MALKSIIAREEEIAFLNTIYSSSKPEFVAIYGRRRVGKTYLVKEFFKAKQGCIFVPITGIKKGSLEEQITQFLTSIAEAFLPGSLKLESQPNWQRAFYTLNELIKNVPKNKKVVIFLDELPWMVTPNSRLVSVIEYFWNHYWSSKNNIKFIVCGSATGWILKNIVNNKDGLYNRVTETIYVKPFTLNQTKKFMSKNGVYLSDRQVLDIYMILGGIPFYLSKITKKGSATQIIGELGFRKNSFLLQEFEKLYGTLFLDAKMYIDIVSTLAKHPEGLTQESLANALKISSGGRLSEQLKVLEQCDFIIRLKSYSHRRKGFFYKIIDEYTLFYLRWLAPFKDSLEHRSLTPGYWEEKRFSPAGYQWAGYAFETVCYKHLHEIRQALNLNPTAIASAWRYTPRKNTEEEGAQIDLLFECEDNIIVIIDAKNTKAPYIFDKLEAENAKRRMRVFKAKTKTNKDLIFALVSANDIKQTMYTEELVSAAATLKDLFH